jgi:hypothetical protein
MQDGVHALTLLLLAAFGPTTPAPVDTARKPPAVVQDGTAPLAGSSSSIRREKPSGVESRTRALIELPPRGPQ